MGKKGNDFWSTSLTSRYAKMLLTGIDQLTHTFLTRAGVVKELQELTREDLCNRDPYLQDDAEVLLGRVEILLRAICQKYDAFAEEEEADGLDPRPLYVQWAEHRLRFVATKRHRRRVVTQYFKPDG